MKNIAILRCLNSNDVCTGAGCLNAFYEKQMAFEQYADEELRLVAFWSCNGCGKIELENQSGLAEKLERIVSLRTDAVHIGICASHKTEDGRRILCCRIKKIARLLRERGIDVVLGTHSIFKHEGKISHE